MEREIGRNKGATWLLGCCLALDSVQRKTISTSSQLRTNFPIKTQTRTPFFQSAEDMAGMTLTPIPYELSVTVAEVTWFAEPISMRGADSVFVRVSGQLVQPGAGDPITLVLKNQTVSY
jgi:hypothetical protein